MEKSNTCEPISPMNETESPSLNDNGKYCLIVKRPDFDGYGFNLHSEKAKPGQYIGKVDADSPAEAAGLREGDRIIEVNGVYIGEETHKQVVQRIKAISNEVRLLLIDVNNESANHSNNDQANKLEQKTVPSEGNKSVNNNTKSVTIVPNEQKVFVSNKTVVLGSTTTSENQKENDCNKNMISTESNTFSGKQNLSLSVTDSAVNESNGQHINSNGQTTDLVSTTTDSLLEQSQRRSSAQQHPLEDATTNKASLNLNLTAAEMRARLLAKKKFDPKSECVDLKKKFDIIQKL